MTRLPNDPRAFAEQVCAILSRIKPDLDVELASPGELIVDGRRLDLDNLHRLVVTDADRGVEIVEQYLDHLFDEQTFAVNTMPWEAARTRIMPRVQPESIFNHLSRDLVAHIPFVNDTVIVFVIDLPNMTVSVTTEQMARWGVNEEELEAVARANLDQYAPTLEFRTVEAEDGGKAILLVMQDGYDASRILLSDLFETLAPEFGGDFYVATPSRDMFLALGADSENFLERIAERVEHDFDRLPYPITDRLFYVTRDGIAGTVRKAA
ncbi:MAG: DUF1444 family protein [Phycisphaerales bacterium]|nr:DUF1444 family protein [Phycisphaerales bacterium]